MQNPINKEDILLYRKYYEVKNLNEKVDFYLSKPKKLSENKYECIYSFVGKSINLTIPVYGHNSFQALILAIFNSYTIVVANNLNAFKDKEDEEPVLKKFYDNFENYIKPTININDLQSKAKDK